jgi:phosphotriesterase-related protein
VSLIRTVTGDIDPSALGVTLIHEHLVTDMRPEWRRGPATPPLDDVRAEIAAHLSALRGLGVAALVECTPTIMGRDLAAYRAFSEASGLRVIAATGSYRDAWLPEWLRRATVDEIAHWFLQGLRAEGAGFIKLGCDPDGPTPNEARCAEAAGMISAQTAALTACHVGVGVSAHRVLDAFERGGGDPLRFIAVHMQNDPAADAHLSLARRGAWVEFDAIGAAPEDGEYVRWISALADAGYLGRVLISQDACAYIVGADGAATRETRFGYLPTRFVPALLDGGFTQADVDALLIDHPRAALTFAG